VIPQVPLAEACEVTMGQAPVGSSYNTNKEGYALIAGAGDYGEITPEPKKYTVKPTRISKPNDLILCIRATIGDLNWSDAEYCLGRGVAGLRPMPGRLDRNYLWHFIQANKGQLIARGTGSTFKQVSRSHIEEWKIPLPPLEEQKHIAAILDKADAIRRKRQQAIDLTDQLLRSVFLDMFGDPVTNPKGWEVKPLESACVEKAGVKAGPFGSALKKEFYTENGYRIYGQEQVIAGTLSIGDYYIDEAKYSKLASCSVESGDMLVSLVGTLGKTLVVPEKFEPGIINPRLVRLRTNKNLLNSEYLQQLFKQPGFQAQLAAYSHGGTMPILNAGIIKSLNVQLPPIELQLRFISILKSIERKMSNFLSAQALNEDLFSSLTQSAFRGELIKQTEAA
jgi:type I restriction enzyme S subunit